jgi:aminoglycoside phosphotransferase (APT) family kinase protein
VRFAAVLGTIDEGDILPHVLEHLRRIGISQTFIFDYGSTDGTLEYLRDAERQGDIVVMHPKQVDEYDVWDTLEARLAIDSKADYVLWCDSDEVLLPAGGTLHSMRLDGHDVVTIPRYNVAVGPDGPHIPLSDPDALLSDTLVWARPIADPYHHLQEHPDTPWIAGSLEPKVLVRSSLIRGMQPGNPGVVADPLSSYRSAVAQDAIIAHVPFRSFERFERRVRNYRAAVEASPEWYAGGQGWQWVRLLRILSEGTVRDEYDLQLTSPEALTALRASGEIRSAREILERLIPPLRSEEEYDAALRRSQPWVAAAAVALEREGLDADLRLRPARLGRYPSVMMPPRHVVKLCGPWRQGHESYERELRAYAILERDPGLPVPRLLAHGALDDDWRYLIRTYAPGVAYLDVRHEMDDADQSALAAWLGRFVARLHAIPLSGEEQEAGRAAFRDHIADRRRRTLAELGATGAVPAALGSELASWLPTLDELLPDGFPVVPVHADLQPESILLSRVDGRYFGKSIIDFDSLLVGHPLYVLGPIWRQVCQGNADSMRRFLEAAGLPGLQGPDMPRIASSWCLLHADVARAGILVGATDEVATLDELAARSFAPASPVVSTA